MSFAESGNYYGILTKPGQSDPQKKVESHSHEMLPEERIMSAFDEHVKMMKNQLIEMILANKSDFFPDSAKLKSLNRRKDQIIQNKHLVYQSYSVSPSG